MNKKTLFFHTSLFIVALCITKNTYSANPTFAPLSDAQVEEIEKDAKKIRDRDKSKDDKKQGIEEESKDTVEQKRTYLFYAIEKSVS